MEAEMGLLGSLLIDPTLIPAMIRKGITAHSFFHPPHGTIWIAVTEMESKGQPIDFIGLAGRLKDHGQLEAVGGPHAINELYVFTPTIANWRRYCERILEKQERRKLIKAAEVLSELAFNEGEDISVVRENAQRIGLEASRSMVADSEVQHAKVPMMEFVDGLQRAMEGTDTRTLLSFGLPTLERLCHNFPPGNLVTIGAQTSVGKTAFALQAAWNVASKQQKPVLFVSLEMSAKKLLGRIAASQSGVSMSKIYMRKPDLSEYDLGKIGESVQKVIGSELYIWTPESTPNISQVVAMIRMQKMENPELALVVVDYLQLLDAANPKDNRERQVADMSKGLARAAVSLDIVIIALSQLNEQHNLRESRAIGHDSRIIGLLSRPDGEVDNGERTLFLQKNSEGQAFVPIALHFAGERQTFREVYEE
jgi:replicative DNA helicase